MKKMFGLAIVARAKNGDIFKLDDNFDVFGPLGINYMKASLAVAKAFYSGKLADPAFEPVCVLSGFLKRAGFEILEEHLPDYPEGAIF